MRQLGSVLLVVAGGTLSLIPAISVVRPGGVITSTDILLWILGGSSVVLGGLFTRIYNEQSLRFSYHRVVDCYKAIAILTLNALLLCGGLELAGFAAFKIRNLSVISNSTEAIPQDQDNPREDISYYSSQDWAKQYWYEHRLSVKQRYYPYVGWRRAPFKGKTIEIDQNGMRLTPGADCRATSYKLFTFGSSEMWGTGSPNWDTIPANLQKGLEKLRRGPVCVMNFAEAAYASTQDVIMLLLQLRSGNVPDVVLFYDIGSDVYSAYQSGQAGLTENFDQLSARFKQGSSYLDHVRNTNSYRLIDALMEKLKIAAPQQEATKKQLVTYESMGIDAAKLSDLVVQNYFGNYKIVDALAQKYGFEYFFVLPPRIFEGNKHLTLEEQEIKHKSESDPALSKLYAAVYQGMERELSQHQNFYSMEHIFDHYDELIWIDATHVTPVGNRMIAGRMMDVIQARSIDERNPKSSAYFRLSPRSPTTG